MIKQIVVFFLVLTSLAVHANDEFPGRVKYHNIGVVELNDLQANFNNYIVIDARSKYEYETLHIKGSINISINSPTFAQSLKALREKNNGPFVFYCNGHTCFKSYKAALKAKSYGFENALSFDAGVFDWAKAFPKQAVLLGQSPIDPNDLIAKSEFKKFLIDPLSFIDLIETSIGILDIRDEYQRDLISLFPFNNETVISLEDKERLNTFLESVSNNEKPLLIYDESGKQVRWLQYRLEQANIKNYWFLKGGSKGFFKYLDSE